MTLFLVGALKATVIVGLGLAATSLLKQSAAARHWLLAVVLACGAATPLLQLVVPSWLSIQPARMMALPTPETTQPASAAPLPSTTPQVEPVATRPATAPPSLSAESIWIAGAGVSLSLLMIGFIRLASLAGRSRVVHDGPWRRIAEDVAREYGIAAPKILQSDHPALLVTWGLRQAKVILPASAPQWTDERIRIVLGHEFAHIRRRDWIVQVAAEIIRCIYWFNPLVWIACARLRHHGEEACDDVVLRRGVQGPDYAQHLLELARMFKRHRTIWSAAPAIARLSGLERRIAAMLNPRIDRTPITVLRRALTAVALLAITIPVSGFAVLEQDTPGRFSGTVCDPTGAPTPEVTVSLTDHTTGATRAVPTDQNGFFDFGSVPPGTYQLEVKGRAFRDIREDLMLEPGSTLRRDFKLNLGTVTENITVGGPPRSAPVKHSTGPRLKEILDSFRGKQVQPPLKLKDVRPVYDQTLRDAGVEGAVVMQGRIAADGSVSGMLVLSSPSADLSRAALDAVNQWQFEPTRLWGTPVEVDMKVTVNFRKE